MRQKRQALSGGFAASLAATDSFLPRRGHTLSRKRSCLQVDQDAPRPLLGLVDDPRTALHHLVQLG